MFALQLARTPSLPEIPEGKGYDVCSCFGSCAGVKDYENREKLFDACGFSEIQRTAYMCALQEYFSGREGGIKK